MSNEVAKTDAKEQKPPAIFAGPQGLSLTSMDDYWRLALAIAKSGLAPKGIESPEAILVAIQMGAEVGLPPMAALQNICVINNRPAIWGDAMLGICRRSGLFDEKAFHEWFEKKGEKEDDFTAFCRVRRLPDGQPIVGDFSIRDAKRADLWGNPKKPIWQQYPQRMLKHRARAFALRDAFADVLRGLHTAEELRDSPDSVIDAEPKNRISRLDAVGDKLAAAISGPSLPEEETSGNGHEPGEIEKALAPKPEQNSSAEAPSNGHSERYTYWRGVLDKQKTAKGRGNVLADAHTDVKAGRMTDAELLELEAAAQQATEASASRTETAKA